jgi:hypothetical protein
MDFNTTTTNQTSDTLLCNKIQYIIIEVYN